jgi:hypothetical protein
MNVISNSDSSSAKSNLDINDIYDLVNDNSNTTNFRENNASNSEAIPLSSESWGRGQRSSYSHGHLQTKMLKKINKSKLI